MLASYIGMSVSVRTNLQTADIANEGKRSPFRTALFGGSVMGFCITGLSLIVLSVLFSVFKDPNALIGFAFGGGLAALFAQIGGGIFTKSADVGADLVGKIEANIPEDDPRNAAVIADLVGDNVGDCAGRGADLFQTFSDDLVTGSIVAIAMASVYGQKGIFFPFLLQSVGVSGDIHIGYLGLIRSILGKIPVEHRSSVMRMIDKKERDALATLLEEIGCSHLGLLELIGSKGESALDRAAQIVADWKPGQEATVQAAAAALEPVSTNEAADVTYSPAGRGSARQGRAVEAQLHLEEFVQTVDLLRAYGVNFTIDFEIVRGLEYYSGTVFEIYAEGLGAQRQICGGGTYELASLFGGKETSSTGFGLGFDRIMEIVQMNSSRPRPVFMAFTPDVKREAARIASRLRESVPVVMDVMGRGLKAQLKAAAGAGADYAVIVGKDELDAGRMTLRDMSGGAQESLLIAEIEARLKAHFQDKFG